MGVDEEGEKVPGGFHLCRATYTAPADCNVANAPIGEDYLNLVIVVLVQLAIIYLVLTAHVGE